MPIFSLRSVLSLLLCLCFAHGCQDDPAPTLEPAEDMAPGELDTGTLPHDLGGDDGQQDMGSAIDAGQPADMADAGRGGGGGGQCSLDCPCAATCEGGTITIYGLGEGWEGQCGEEPSCGVPTTHVCPNGCAADFPARDASCQAARDIESGMLDAYCVP